MTLLWIFFLTVDKALQLTSRAEMASLLNKLGIRVNTIVFYEQKKMPLNGFAKVNYLHRGRGIFSKIWSSLLLQRATLNSPSDIIMVDFRSSYLVPLLFLKKRIASSKQRIIMDIRGLPTGRWRLGFIANKLEEFRFRLSLCVANHFCDAVTVISEELKERIINFLPRIRNRIGVWGSGANFRRFDYRLESDVRKQFGLSDSFLLMYHGVIGPGRGLENVLSAMTIIRRKHPNVRFLVVGDGPLKSGLIRLARELQVIDTVIITGRVLYENIPKYIKACDVGILPFPKVDCWDTSSPLKLMEYLAMRKKVIVTDIAAHRSVIDRTGGGFFIKNNQPETIADAVGRLIEKGDNAVSKIIDDKELEKHIGWETEAKRLYLFLRSL